jgi:hypothetical protein
MKLAISLTTYQRKDGKSPFYLKRAIDSVCSQTHQDWHLFVVGDHYENEMEFLMIMSQYSSDKISFVNLDRSVERDKYGDNGPLLWHSAGITAMNYASKMSLDAGYDYVCHLDHDDYWQLPHLELINRAIEQENADFVCTLSTFGTSRLPAIGNDNRWILPFLPLSCGLINSSSCYNHRKIPLRYENVWERDKQVVPADADLWIRLAKYLQENNLKSYCVNELTCIHDEEGYLLHG